MWAKNNPSPLSSTPCGTPTKETYPPLACGVDRLHHRFLRPNALKHGVSTNSIGHVHDPGDALVATLSHDVGCAEFACEFLPRGVPAYRDDPLRTHLPGGEYAEEADRAVTDDYDRRARLHVRRVGCEPAGPQNIGSRQQARDQIVRGDARRSHQRAVR